MMNNKNILRNIFYEVLVNINTSKRKEFTKIELKEISHLK